MRQLFFLHLPKMKQMMQVIYPAKCFMIEGTPFFLHCIQRESTLRPSLILAGNCAKSCAHGTLLDTMSVLHCTDTFHHRDSASLLLILSVSLFCLVLSVCFFICLFFALSLGFPAVCALVMPPSVRCHAAAWHSSTKHGRLSLSVFCRVT